VSPTGALWLSNLNISSLSLGGLYRDRAWLWLAGSRLTYRNTTCTLWIGSYLDYIAIHRVSFPRPLLSPAQLLSFKEIPTTAFFRSYEWSPSRPSSVTTTQSGGIDQKVKRVGMLTLWGLAPILASDGNSPTTQTHAFSFAAHLALNR